MVNLNQSNLMLIIILSMNLFMNIQSFRGFIHFEILCWKNPGHLTYKGEKCDPKEALPNCDPFFVICINDRAIPGSLDKENCLIHFENTSHFANTDNVCNNVYGDNRGSLQHWIKIGLLAIPEKYFIKIQVQDYNLNSNPDLIATFSNEFSQTPASNLYSLNMEDIEMNRSERNFSNPDARLKIKMGTQCERFLYGKDCMTECRDFRSGNFYCAKNGKKYCNQGWTGRYCEITDSCEKLKCARGATCNISDNEAKCMCNGRIAPECYQNYIPCTLNPCRNNGKCVSYENSGQQCKCVRGYFGDLCEKTDENWGIIGSIIGLIVILVVIAIVFGCICLRRRAENLQNKEIHMDHMREDMDDNHYTYIQENNNRSSYGQRFYADEVQQSEKV